MIARLQAWGAALLAAIAAVVAAFGWGRWRGQRAQRERNRSALAAAQQRAANAEDAAAQMRTRSEIESDVLHLPASTPSRVVDAAAESAAGRLRDDWSRD